MSWDISKPCFDIGKINHRNASHDSMSCFPGGAPARPLHADVVCDADWMQPHLALRVVGQGRRQIHLRLSGRYSRQGEHNDGSRHIHSAARSEASGRRCCHPCFWTVVIELMEGGIRASIPVTLSIPLRLRRWKFRLKWLTCGKKSNKQFH